jgi:hypothetical protein
LSRRLASVLALAAVLAVLVVPASPVLADTGPRDTPRWNFSIGDIYTERIGDAGPKVVIRVANTGRRSIDLGGTLALSSGPGGGSVSLRAASTPATLAPGQHGTVTAVAADDVLLGPWTFRLVLSGGSISHTARGTLTFPAKPNGPDLQAVVALLDSRVPLALAGTGALAALGVIVLLAVGLRRGRRPTSRDTAWSALEFDDVTQPRSRVEEDDGRAGDLLDPVDEGGDGGGDRVAVTTAAHPRVDVVAER